MVESVHRDGNNEQKETKMTRNGWHAQEIAASDVAYVSEPLPDTLPQAMKKRKRKALALKMAASVLEREGLRVHPDLSVKQADYLYANLGALPDAIASLGENPQVTDLMRLVRTCGI
jgi:hypothetical protein